MWFGGEEDGLVGSQYYAANLPQAEVDKIMVMIDTDMIASPNYVRLVYDGDGSELGPAGPPGSGVVENVFKRYFAERGMADAAAGVRRPLRLRRVHQPRHPGGRHLRRRRGPEDGGAGRDLRRRRRASSTTRATTRRATTSARSRASRPPSTMNVFATDPGAGAGAGRLAQRERAEVAPRDVGRRDARGLVLRARQGRAAAARGRGQRGQEARGPEGDEDVPLQVRGPSPGAPR